MPAEVAVRAVDVAQDPGVEFIKAMLDGKHLPSLLSRPQVLQLLDHPLMLGHVAFEVIVLVKPHQQLLGSKMNRAVFDEAVEKIKEISDCPNFTASHRA